MNKKILVLGTNGQLGQEVVRVFSDKDKYDLIAPKESEADITSSLKIQDLIKKACPNVIVNCAAFTNVDKCETEILMAEAVNSLGPEYIAKAAMAVGAFFIHISTDYVYDGRTNFEKVTYKLNGLNEHPLNNYGLTKKRGEELIIEQMHSEHPYDYVILRTSGLYGRYGNNFLSRMKKTIYDSLSSSNTFSLIVDQWYCPTSALQLARQIKIWADLSEKDREYIISREGNVLNANNLGFTSPYSFFSQYAVLADYFGFLSHISPIRFSDYFCARAKTTAERPKAVVLKNELAEKYGKELNAFTTIEEALEEYIEAKKGINDEE